MHIPMCFQIIVYFSRISTENKDNWGRQQTDWVTAGKCAIELPYVLEAIRTSYFLIWEFNITRSPKEDHVEVFSLMHFTNQLYLAFSLGKSFPALCWNSPTPPPTHTHSGTQLVKTGIVRSPQTTPQTTPSSTEMLTAFYWCLMSLMGWENHHLIMPRCAHTYVVCLCLFNDQWSASIGF